MCEEYPLMAFIANEGVAPKGDRYDRSALVSDTGNKKYKRTEKNDFIYSSNNLETGSIGLNKYGNATISPVYSIFYSTGIADADFIGRSWLVLYGTDKRSAAETAEGWHQMHAGKGSGE